MISKAFLPLLALALAAGPVGATTFDLGTPTYPDPNHALVPISITDFHGAGFGAFFIRADLNPADTSYIDGVEASSFFTPPGTTFLWPNIIEQDSHHIVFGFTDQPFAYCPNAVSAVIARVRIAGGGGTLRLKSSSVAPQLYNCAQTANLEIGYGDSVRTFAPPPIADQPAFFFGRGPQDGRVAIGWMTLPSTGVRDLKLSFLHPGCTITGGEAGAGLAGFSPTFTVTNDGDTSTIEVAFPGACPHALSLDAFRLVTSGSGVITSADAGTHRTQIKNVDWTPFPNLYPGIYIWNTVKAAVAPSNMLLGLPGSMPPLMAGASYDIPIYVSNATSPGGYTTRLIEWQMQFSSALTETALLGAPWMRAGSGLGDFLLPFWAADGTLTAFYALAGGDPICAPAQASSAIAAYVRVVVNNTWDGSTPQTVTLVSSTKDGQEPGPLALDCADYREPTTYGTTLLTISPPPPPGCGGWCCTHECDGGAPKFVAAVKGPVEWYDVAGRKLSAKPEGRGIYFVRVAGHPESRKVVVR